MLSELRDQEGIVRGSSDPGPGGDESHVTQVLTTRRSEEVSAKVKTTSRKCRNIYPYRIPRFHFYKEGKIQGNWATARQKQLN